MTISEIYQYLEKNNVYPEDIRESWDNLNTIVITIRGDWKHDHLRCKYLMGNIGYERVCVIETESDGSDFYIGDHYYDKVQ